MFSGVPEHGEGEGEVGQHDDQVATKVQLVDVIWIPVVISFESAWSLYLFQKC